MEHGSVQQDSLKALAWICGLQDLVLAAVCTCTPKPPSHMEAVRMGWQ